MRSLQVPFFLLWEQGPIYIEPAGLYWCFFPTTELVYSARAPTACGHMKTEHTMILLTLAYVQAQGRFLHTVGMWPYFHKWHKLPVQSVLQSHRGTAKSQPALRLLMLGISALHQHLHVVYISMQIFRLWFVTLHVTPRCSVGKAKQGPGKGSKTPPGPSRTMTKLWDILSPNNGNSPGILP